jgi:hypothetical protein
MLMVAKMDKISSESSKKVTGPSSGFSITLEQNQALHTVLQEALSMIKKSSLLNIQVVVRPLSMQELL